MISLDNWLNPGCQIDFSFATNKFINKIKRIISTEFSLAILAQCSISLLLKTSENPLGIMILATKYVDHYILRPDTSPINTHILISKVCTN